MIISVGLEWLKTSPSQFVCRAQKWHWDLCKRRSQTWRFWVSVATSAQTKNLRLSTGGYFLLCICTGACVCACDMCLRVYTNSAVCVIWQSLLNSSAHPWLLNLSPYSLLHYVYLSFTWSLHTLAHTTVPLISAGSSNRAVFLHWQIRIYWNVLCDVDNRLHPFLTKYRWWNNNRICVIIIVVW